MTDALFALVFAPMEASIAVTQVPMLIPKVTNIALCRDISDTPSAVTEHSVISIEVVADED